MVWKGFKFGMLLQLAIGPVCLFIFQIASQQGFVSGSTGVLGVALVDGLFILLATLGIASLMEVKNVRVFLKFFGVFILLLFGTSTVLGALGIHFLPTLSLGTQISGSHVFAKGILLTISNPLTIIFWAGVFSSKVAEENMKKVEIYWFGVGAVLSTLVFLLGIALLGSVVKVFLSQNVLQIFNIAVGMMLIYFAIKMARRKV